MSKVIACLDGTAVTEAVTDAAAWASARLSAPLTLLHVLDRGEFPVESDLSGNLAAGGREALLGELAELDRKRARLAMEQGRILLEAAAARVGERDGPPVEHMQRHGSLLETLEDLEADLRLLVLGKHDENLREHVGSRLESVVRTMQRPILVTTPEFTPPQRIMIAYDGSATTRKAVDMVAGSPLFAGLPVHLVMAGPDNTLNRQQMEWARHTLEAADFGVTCVIQPGEVEQVLCNYRRDQEIDLIVMGAWGHSVIRRFLVGSTTTCVVRNAKVPVLLLR